MIRFSALGDVAMTIPVIYSCAVEHPELEITVLSRSMVAPLFTRMPANVHFQGVNLKEFGGLAGLHRLYQLVRQGKFDAVADFHDVLRTKYLRFRFRLAGVKVAHIDKGRAEKKALTRMNHKCKQPLKTTVSRYVQVLHDLGLSCTVRFASLFGDGRGDLSEVVSMTGEKGADRWVGFAPFAAHPGKEYPKELLEEVLRLLDALPGVKVLVFGAGEEQRLQAEAWAKQYPQTVVSLVGKAKMDKELVVMSHLDVMFSMDSANMHLASLVHTPVVSVWGATHPYAGFLGWNQQAEDALCADLPCQPCSIFGNKGCRAQVERPYQCMYALTPERVVAQLKKYCSNTK